MQGYPPRLLAVSEKCPKAMLQRDYWSIKDFVLYKEVGSGAASTVYLAFCRKSTLQVAMKMYLKSKLSRLNRTQVDREINIHSSFNHPHIVDFYAAFEDDERIYLVQEFAAGGDLFDDVKKRGGRLAEAEVVQSVLYPYLCALLYMHSRGIIHRDIKPENTVFTKDRVMKVTDFGLAVNSTMERPVTRLGTLDYMAPEVLRCPDKHNPEDNKDRSDLEYTTSVDAWAMGVLAYELIVGRPPFGMSCRDATMRAISAATPSIPDWMSPGAADFVRSALQRTPARRATVAQLIQHPWVLAHTGQRMISEPDYTITSMLENTRSAHSSCSTTSLYSTGSTASGQIPHHASMASISAAASGHSMPIAVHAFAAPSAAAAAASAYSNPMLDVLRSSKRHVQRSHSAFLSASQGNLLSLPTQKVHDTSYWMTDGDGFSHDPLAYTAAPALGADSSSFHMTPTTSNTGNSMDDGFEAPATAAEYYKLHLEDLRNVWEGGRGPGRSLSHKSMSRSFSMKNSNSVKRRTPDTPDLDHPPPLQLGPSASYHGSPGAANMQLSPLPGLSNKADVFYSPSRLSKMKRTESGRVTYASLDGGGSPMARPSAAAAAFDQLTITSRPNDDDMFGASLLLSGVPLSPGESGYSSQTQMGGQLAQSNSLRMQMQVPGVQLMITTESPGPRSHPISSPYATPLNSPFVHGKHASANFNQLIDMMEAEGVLPQSSGHMSHVLRDGSPPSSSHGGHGPSPLGQVSTAWGTITTQGPQHHHHSSTSASALDGEGGIGWRGSNGDANVGMSLADAGRAHSSGYNSGYMRHHQQQSGSQDGIGLQWNSAPGWSLPPQPQRATSFTSTGVSPLGMVQFAAGSGGPPPAGPSLALGHEPYYAPYCSS